MTTPTSATIVNALVAASCITVGAIAQNSTRAEKDEAQQQEMVRQAECDAISAAYGVDPWRGTSIGTLVRQREEAAAKSQAEEQMTLMTAHSDTADSDDQFDAGDEDVTDGYEIVFVDDDGAYVDEENDFETDHIDVTAIECDNQSVLIGLSWPVSMEIEKWDVYLIGSLDLDGPAIFENKINPVAGTTNQIVTLTSENFPSNAIPNQCFIRIKAIKDSDHDGLSDEKERRWGTDPDNPDSDGDGYADGYEIGNGTDPLREEVEQSSFEEIEGVYYSTTGSFSRIDFVYNRELYNDTDAEIILSTPRSGSQPNSGLDYSMESSEADPFAYTLSGIKFCPEISGYYCFQIAADDYAYLQVGEITSIADWHSGNGGVGNIAIGYFEGGMRYDVKIFHRNDGGLAFMRILKFGQFASVRPRISNIMDGNVVIYEQPYLTMPHNVIVSNSTTVISRIKAFSGMRGGLLKIRTQNIDKLLCCEGVAVADGDYMLPPNTEFSIVGSYYGVCASLEQDDVKISAVFEESDSDCCISKEVTATVIELAVRTQFDLATLNNQRHELGPLETVSLSHSPQTIPITWQGQTAVRGQEYTDGSSEYSRNNFELTTMNQIDVMMPKDVGPVYVQASALGQCFDLRFSVTTPKRTVRVDAKVPTLEDWRVATRDPNFVPQELYCGLSVVIKVEPEYVVFNNIRIAEGICPLELPSGTLANLGPHDASAGAFVVQEIGRDNISEKKDFAAKHNLGKINNSWSGHGEWNIPMMWKSTVEETNDWSRAKIFTYNRQIFHCTDNGVLSIKKFNCIYRRQIKQER